MADSHRSTALPAPLVALCGWLVPGLGYLLIGQKTRAIISGSVILATFLAGILIGGIRVIDVPGYDPAGQPKMLRIARTDDTVWALKYDFKGEVLNKPWYIAQTLVGPTNIIATWGSMKAADAGHRMSTARVFDIGTLYTAVAGMLNLLVILDATYRATKPPLPEHETPHDPTFEQPTPTSYPAEGTL
ncbi:MAG: hypothetical protein JWM57_1730 [Phycisphaerales bacterium]|nr:hypothetical protein [Phycisphaerales bacterium]